MITTPMSPHWQTLRILRECIKEIRKAADEYLPPDGISAAQFATRVIGAIDNPDINAAMREEK